MKELEMNAKSNNAMAKISVLLNLKGEASRQAGNINNIDMGNRSCAHWQQLQ